MGCAAAHCRVPLLMAVSCPLAGGAVILAFPHVMTAPLSTEARVAHLRVPRS